MSTKRGTTQSERGRVRVEGFDVAAVETRDRLSAWEPELQSQEGRGRLSYAWERFRRNRLATLGSVVIVAMMLVAIFARPIQVPADAPVLAGMTVQPFSLAPA
ncbi:MAG: hypothetical protein J07HR59_00138, partial [Halorubrum sp. J07HR59]